ncbi:MAG: formylglycine-generating enzyme family protein [Planctomycetes bacterium]|nr:formylglycine-generating enzyme family protein [Planctomycetota bacterium]
MHELWAVYAHRNPQGLWRVRSTMPLDRLAAEPKRNAAAEKRELESLKALSPSEAAARQEAAARTGRSVRLPTEAEWEHACRAGTTTCFYWGDDWGDKSDGTRLNAADKNAPVKYPDNRFDDGHAHTAPVAQYPPNAWGLYDMLGNVSEWCSDWYDPEWYLFAPRQDPTGPATGCIHVARGGNWQDSIAYCRATFRSFHRLNEPSMRASALGFRVVVDASPHFSPAGPAPKER